MKLQLQVTKIQELERSIWDRIEGRLEPETETIVHGIRFGHLTLFRPHSSHDPEKDIDVHLANVRGVSERYLIRHNLPLDEKHLVETISSAGAESAEGYAARLLISARGLQEMRAATRDCLDWWSWNWAAFALHWADLRLLEHEVMQKADQPPLERFVRAFLESGPKNLSEYNESEQRKRKARQEEISKIDDENSSGSEEQRANRIQIKLKNRGHRVLSTRTLRRYLREKKLANLA